MLTTDVATSPYGFGPAAADLTTMIVAPAVTAAVVAGLVSLIQVYVTGRRDRNKQLLEFRLRQINELYAPILYALAQTHSLGRALREAAPPPANGETWHLLDNLQSVRSDDQLSDMAAQIVTKNVTIKEILELNVGLSLHEEIPLSYHEFISHAELVQQGVRDGVIPQNVSAKYFPKDFEAGIARSYEEIVIHIRKAILGKRRKAKS